MKLLTIIFCAPLALSGCQSLEPGTQASLQSPPTSATNKSKGRGNANAPITKATPKPYPLKVCLVTDEGLDDWDEQTNIIYQGHEIKFCCKMCVKKFYKSPQKYMSKLK